MSGAKKILLVEDSEDFSFALRRILKRVANDVVLEEHTDGDEALAYLRRAAERSELPKLVLLDLNMPGRDGRSVLVEIKSSELLHHLPVVVLTTSNRNEDVRFAYRHGARAFHVKPDHIDGLEAMVATLHRYWFEAAKLP